MRNLHHLSGVVCCLLSGESGVLAAQEVCPAALVCVQQAVQVTLTLPSPGTGHYPRRGLEGGRVAGFPDPG